MRRLSGHRSQQVWSTHGPHRDPRRGSELLFAGRNHVRHSDSFAQASLVTRRGEGKDTEEALREGDALLESAYVSSMRASQERDIELLGFSLLSSGVFRGSRSLDEVD
jgi:hypothetical protein